MGNEEKGLEPDYCRIEKKPNKRKDNGKVRG